MHLSLLTFCPMTLNLEQVKTELEPFFKDNYPGNLLWNGLSHPVHDPLHMLHWTLHGGYISTVQASQFWKFFPFQPFIFTRSKPAL